METLAVELRDGVQWVTLQRPAVLNAMNSRMEDELLEAFDAAAGDPAVRVVVLRGAGPCFSAGHDAKAMGQRARPGSLFAAALALEKPIVASLHGYALGASLQLALCCDLRIAAQDTRLAMPFAKRGVVGATWILPRVVGLATATRLLFLDDEVSGEEAERIGLVHRAVDPGDLAAETEELAQRLASAATRAIGIMKRAMHESYGMAAEAGLASQRAALDEVRKTSDYAEGLAASRERRAPRFEGR